MLSKAEKQELLLEQGIWNTKDGRRLLIKDMTTTHIKAVIRLIENHLHGVAQQYTRIMKEELLKRKGANNANNE